MDVVKVMDYLGWPVSFKTMERAEEEKEGWYFFGGDLFIDREGGLWFGENRVTPKVWANLAAMFEIYHRNYVGALLNLVRYDRLKPVWKNCVYADGVYFSSLAAFDAYVELEYDWKRKEFRKRDGDLYFAAYDPSIEMTNLLRVTRTPCGLFAVDDFGFIDFVKAPFQSWEYVGRGESTSPSITRRGNYVVYGVEDGGLWMNIVCGPWVRAVFGGIMPRIDDYVRPGWVFIGDGWLKKVGRLYVFESAKGEDTVVKNRWGKTVADFDGVVEAIELGAFSDFFRLRALL